jgi:hypothetical protein
MAQFNDWSKSYQNSLGNAKLAAVKTAGGYSSGDRPLNPKEAEFLQGHHDGFINHHEEMLDHLKDTGMKRDHPIYQAHQAAFSAHCKAKPHSRGERSVAEQKDKTEEANRLTDVANKASSAPVAPWIESLMNQSSNKISFVKRYASEDHDWDDAPRRRAPQVERGNGWGKHCNDCGSVGSLVRDPSQEYGTGYICHGGCEF